MVGYISKKLGEVGRYNKDEIERIKKKMVRGNGLQELKEHVCPQNERPMREIGVSYAMNKMGKNLGIYYRYLMEEKKLAEKGTDGEQTPEEIQGGLVLMQKSQIKRVNNENKDSKSHKERVSDIYSFEERSEIFKKLEPFKIIKFDTIDEDSQVIPGAYTTFVFRNPNNKNGFLFINEPYDGDKETRAIFLSEEQFSEIIGGQENIDNKLWCDTARDYIEMSRSDFKDDKTGNKYIFRHRSLENYREMMMGVIKGKEPDKSWKRGKESVDRAKKVLYGGEKIVQQSDVKKIAENDVSEQQVKDARNIIFTPKYRDGKAVSIQ